MCKKNPDAIKVEILTRAKQWFQLTIVANHKLNTVKLKKANEFDINPFLAPYLGAFMEGEVTPESVAKGLVYPRALGTSITTSFGTGMQRFVTDVLKNTFGSTTAGIDIEFTDQTDGRKKYCQVKLGPNTINADDVDTINNHFSTIKKLAITNNLPIEIRDLVVGVVHGTETQLSGHYKKLRDTYHFPLYVGKKFWYCLTGEEKFYEELIQVIASVAVEIDGKELLEETIKDLANTKAIKEIAFSPADNK